MFALTVVPALCALVLRPKDAEVREPKLLGRVRDGYAARWWPGCSAAASWSLAGVAALLLVDRRASASRLGSEFLPELDEGDIVIFVEMPPSISLERAREHPAARCGGGCCTFPEVLETLSEQGRPEDGTDDEGVNMSETFVHAARPRTSGARAGRRSGSSRRCAPR